MYKHLEGLNLEEIEPHNKKTANPKASSPPGALPKGVETHFAEGMVDNFHLKRPRSFWDFAVSVLGHSVVVAVLILLPLYFTQAINLKQYQNTFLIAPPPPPLRPRRRRCMSRRRECLNPFSSRASCMRQNSFPSKSRK